MRVFVGEEVSWIRYFVRRSAVQTYVGVYVGSLGPKRPPLRTGPFPQGHRNQALKASLSRGQSDWMTGREATWITLGDRSRCETELNPWSESAIVSLLLSPHVSSRRVPDLPTIRCEPIGC